MAFIKEADDRATKKREETEKNETIKKNAVKAAKKEDKKSKTKPKVVTRLPKPKGKRK